MTTQDIRPDLQYTTAFYLARINQQLSSQLNEPQELIPASLSSNPAQLFSAPTLAVWVNGLWFLSLVISLTCAMMATLLQQWARRYLEVAYPPLSPPKRARIRAFYSEASKTCTFPGQSKHCQRYSIFPFSYSSPASLYSCSMCISPSLGS